MKYIFSIAIIILSFNSYSIDSFKLDIQDKDENELFMQKFEKNIKNVDSRFIVGNNIITTKLSDHGNSGLLSKNRKSFELKFEHKVRFNGFFSNKFIFNSFPEDVFYINMNFSDKILVQNNLLFSEGHYAWGSINKRLPELFYIQLNPKDVLKKNKNIVLSFRSDRENKIKPLFGIETDAYKYYRELKTLVNENINNENLYSILREHMDIDLYLKYIAINRILRNCDYIDELFWSLTRSNNKLGYYASDFYAWDFEQIMCSNTAENLSNDNIVFLNSGFLSDAIIQNKKVRAKYKNILLKLILSDFNEKVIQKRFSQIRSELDEVFRVKNSSREITKYDVDDYLNYLNRALRNEVMILLKILWKESE